MGPEVMLRYYPIVEIIKKSEYKVPKILEVGSGAEGLSFFLDQKITALDINFGNDIPENIRPIRGSATHIPFENDTFDFVVSVDMLEHLDPKDREQAISEMIRVSKERIILACPCDEESEKYEKRINEYHITKFKQEHGWLKEHIKNGLPRSNEVLKILDYISTKYPRGLKVNILKNVNVRLFYLLRWAEIFLSKNPCEKVYHLSKNNFKEKVKTVLEKLLLSILKHVNWGKCYRKIFVIFKINKVARAKKL